LALFRYLLGHPEPCRGDLPAAPLMGFEASFAVLILPASGAVFPSIAGPTCRFLSVRPDVPCYVSRAINRLCRFECTHYEPTVDPGRSARLLGLTRGQSAPRIGMCR
jgi:hypothetical protein